MAITVVGTASNNGATADGDLTVTLPGGVAENDLVIAAYNHGGNANTDYNVAMVTADYTEEADLFGNDTNETNLGVFYKFQGGTPDSTAVFDVIAATAGYGMAGAVYVLRGVDTTTPKDATSISGAGGNSSVVDPGQITTVTADALVLAIGATSQVSDGPPTAPSGYSDLIEDQSAVTFNANIMMASKSVASPGAENPGAFGNITDSTAHSFATLTMALRPAAGASGRIMGALAWFGGLAGPGGLAGSRGGLAA